MRTSDHERSLTPRLTLPALLYPVCIPAGCVALLRFTDEALGGMAVLPVSVLVLAAMVYGVACRRRIMRFVAIYRNNRFYINAKESTTRALTKVLVIGILAAVLLVLFGAPVSRAVTGSVKARLPLYVSVICMVLHGPNSVTAAFLAGMGRHKTVWVADLFRTVTAVLFFLPAGIFGYHRVGKPLDALLFTDDCGAAYALLYAFFGVLLSEILTCAILFVARRNLLRSLAPLHETGKPRFLGDEPLFLLSVWPMALAVSLPVLFVIVQCVFFHASHPTELGPYTGHFLPVTLIIGVLTFLPLFPLARTVTRNEGEDDEEEEGDPERIPGTVLLLLRRCAIFGIPAGTFLMALSETLESALFLVPSDGAILLLTLGGILAPLISFAVCVMTVLVNVKRMRRLLIACIPAVLAGAGVCFVTVVLLHLGVYGLLVSVLIAFLIADVAGIRFLAGLYALRQRSVLRLIARPFCLSGIAAIVLFLVSRVLTHLIGEIPTLILCVFAGGILYLVLMAAFRGLEEGDLRQLPFGALLERISMRGRRA